MKIKKFLVIISVVVLSAVLGYRFGFSQSGNFLKSIVEPGSMVTEASYVIFTDGSTVYARNGNTGEIEFSGLDASNVIQSTINQLTSGGKIFVRAGYYNLSAPIVIDKNHNAIVIEGEGFSRAEDIGTRFKPPSNDYAFKVEGTSIAYPDCVHHVEFRNFGISIPTADHTISGSGIKLKYVHGSLLENIWMWNLKGYGLYIEQAAEGKFDQVDMRYCGDASSNASTLEIVGDGYTNHLMFTRLWIGQPYYYGLRVSAIYFMGSPQWISIIQGYVHGSADQTVYGMTSNYPAVQLLGVDNFYMQDMYIGYFNATLVNITDGVSQNFHVDISRCHFQLADSAISSAATFGDIHDNYFLSLSKYAIITQRNQHDIHDNYFYYPYYNVNNTYSYIVLNSSYNLVKGNYFYDSGTINQSKYSVEELAGVDYNRIEGNNLYAGVTAKVVKVGGSTIIKNNNGYVTEKNGIQAITSGSTIVTVNHGLDSSIDPTKIKITVTPNWLTTFRVYGKTNNQFSVEFGTAAPSSAQIDWYAEV